MDLEKDFQPVYVPIQGKSKIIRELKKASKEVDNVYLGPDPDREGEAIAWHIAEEIGNKKKKVYRVLFNEITKKAVLDALKHPGGLQQSKFEAQQASRILDDHLERIALPLGGIGTGTVSLGGRGNLVDWEIMNRPAKGFVPWAGQQLGPFFVLHISGAPGPGAAAALKTASWARALEGPLPLSVYEASHGATAVNHGLPRFPEASFAAAYPLGQVLLSGPGYPVDVRLEAWNPLVPGDADASGVPAAVLRYVIINRTDRPLRASVCGTVPNFIGADGSKLGQDWKSDPVTAGPKKNRNGFRKTAGLRGIFMSSDGVDPKDEAFGTIALTAAAGTRGTSRTAWLAAGWGTPLLDFWHDFSADGALDPRAETGVLETCLVETMKDELRYCCSNCMNFHACLDMEHIPIGDLFRRRVEGKDTDGLKKATTRCVNEALRRTPHIDSDRAHLLCGDFRHQYRATTIGEVFNRYADIAAGLQHTYGIDYRKIQAEMVRINLDFVERDRQTASGQQG